MARQRPIRAHSLLRPLTRGLVLSFNCILTTAVVGLACVVQGVKITQNLVLKVPVLSTVGLVVHFEVRNSAAQMQL